MTISLRSPMKSIFCKWQLITFLFFALGAHAADSTLRIKCGGSDIGAEVFINGKFRGECPLDILVKPGSAQVRAVKVVDGWRERVFEQTLRMGEDTIKPLEVILTERLTATAKKQDDDRQRTFWTKVTKGKACAECPDMVVIPAGNFQMGSNERNNEKPIHSVSIKSFAMGKTEVTQALWTAIMGSNPSKFRQCGQDCPVEQVSWDDVQQFLHKLNAHSGMRFRLPSEAEWEYAARSGSTGKYGFGNDPDLLGRFAWYEKNSDGQTHPVAHKIPNAFGLYDMHGNVWEWVEDWHQEDYIGAPTDGIAWVNGDDRRFRVLRGGNYFYDPGDLRSAGRYGEAPDYRIYYIGFRLAMTLP